MSASLEDANEVLRQAYSGTLQKHQAQVSQLLNMYRRNGHSEPATTDEAWQQEQADREERFEAWQALTKELFDEGVLDNAHCYECEGVPILNTTRPTQWVWDESEEDFTARLEAERSV